MRRRKAYTLWGFPAWGPLEVCLCISKSGAFLLQVGGVRLMMPGRLGEPRNIRR
jgi:hypothetical protein